MSYIDTKCYFCEVQINEINAKFPMCSSCAKKLASVFAEFTKFESMSPKKESSISIVSRIITNMVVFTVGISLITLMIWGVLTIIRA